MGRRPIGVQAMSDAERMKRYRERLKQKPKAQPGADPEELRTANARIRVLTEALQLLKQQQRREAKAAPKPEPKPKPPRSDNEQIVSLQARLKKAHGENRYLHKRLKEVNEATYLNPRGFMSGSQWKTITLAVHPDRQKADDPEIRNKAMQLLLELRPLMVFSKE